MVSLLFVRNINLSMKLFSNQKQTLSLKNLIIQTSCVVFIMIIASCKQNTQDSMVFSDKHDARIDKFIKQMTLEEKLGQMIAYRYLGRSKPSNANVRLGIPNLVTNGCVHGVMADGATTFPQAIAMASTWDPVLIEKMGNIVAKEARALGIHQSYSPMIAVVRDVRWGRIEESFGEDPFLVGNIGVAYINGLQGTGAQRFDKEHILACVKHYVADGEPLAGGNGAAMDVSEYNLHNIHLYPFRMALVEARAASLMPAHHYLNGVPCHANNYIMNDILRDQYKWNGLVVSDNQDLPHLVQSLKYTPDYTDAALKALKAGIHQELDMSIEGNRLYGNRLAEAVKAGDVPEELVDEAVATILRAKFEIGLFGGELPSIEKSVGLDSVPPAVENYKEILNNVRHDELALEVAHKAIVLLKNNNSTLPLNLDQLKTIAVIGPNADIMRLGGYSTSNPKYFITILDGIKKYVGNRAEVSYAEGTGIDIKLAESVEHDVELTNIAKRSNYEPSVPESKKISEAVALAAKSDIVILAIGGSEATCRENEDVDYLGLTGRQLELVKAVHGTGTPCIVVFLGGRPISEPWIAENIPAIIQGWYLGQETGTAIADVLFGKVNPGGKLPVTIPRNVGQVPLFYNMLETGRPRRIYRSSPEPLYPFGHGLSYTTFNIDNMKLESNNIYAGGKTRLSVDIANTGKVAGDEVVQLYIRALYNKKARPKKELRGFQRISLSPGEKKTIYFEIGKKQLEYWNESWVVEPGAYDLFVAANSSDQSLELNKTKLIVQE